MLEVSEVRMLTRVATKRVRNTLAVSPRVPRQGYSSEGKPAPKTRAKAVVDGNQVNIPELSGGDEI